MNNGLCNVFRLRQPFRLIDFALSFTNTFLHRCRRAAGVNTHHSDTVGIDFLTQAVGYRLESMFGRGIQPDIRTSRNPGAGIDEYDLAFAAPEQRQQLLRQQKRRANVGKILPVETGTVGGFKRANANNAGAVNKHIDAAVPVLKAIRQLDDIFLHGQVDLIRLDVFDPRSGDGGHCVQGLRVATQQAERRAVRCEFQCDRPADAASGARDDGNAFREVSHRCCLTWIKAVESGRPRWPTVADSITAMFKQPMLYQRIGGNLNRFEP